MIFDLLAKGPLNAPDLPSLFPGPWPSLHLGAETRDWHAQKQRIDSLSAGPVASG